MKLQDQYPIIPSPHFNDRKNEVKYPKFLILHYTVSNFESTKNNFLDPASQVSSHYVLDTDGQVYIFVPEEKRAWHAGVSYFDGVGYNLTTRKRIYGDMNSASIGIEIVNPGYDKVVTDLKVYTKPQIKSLRILVSNIVERYNIPPKYVLGHSDIAPNRKFDPGFYFPWNQLTHPITNKPLAVVLTDEMIANEDPSNLPTDVEVSKALSAYGYSIDNLANTKLGFQERFNPMAWLNNELFGDEDKKRLLALSKKQPFQN